MGTQRAVQRACAYEGQFLGGLRGDILEKDKCFIASGQQGKRDFPGCRSGKEGTGWGKEMGWKKERILCTANSERKMETKRWDVTNKGRNVGIMATVTSTFWKARWMKMKMINVHTNRVEGKFPRAQSLQDSCCICVRDISSVIPMTWQCNYGQQQCFIQHANSHSQQMF